MVNAGSAYTQVIHQTEQFAAVLQARGVRRGDHIAVYLQRSIESIVALFAVWSLGGVVVIINDVLKNRQVNYIIGSFGGFFSYYRQSSTCLAH